MPEISGMPLQPLHSSAPVLALSLHTLQHYASDLGQTFAYPASSCLGFQADDSYLGMMSPRFRAYHFESSMICPRSETCYCTPCIDMPQISGRLLQDVNDNSGFSGRCIQLRNNKLQESLNPSENKNELPRSSDISCHFKNAIAVIAVLVAKPRRNHPNVMFSASTDSWRKSWADSLKLSGFSVVR